MAYSREVYASAQQELAARRLAAQQQAEELHARMRKNPRVWELERVMASSAQKVARAVLSGQCEQQITAIQAENQAAQQELAALLEAAGETARDFEPRYTCPRCQDTGYVGSEKCSCFVSLLQKAAIRQLTGQIGMKLQSFDTFDLTYYSDKPDSALGCSPREHMTSVRDFARWYGESFDTQHKSLLLYGATGTGKTHLSLAMAAAACARGADVIYGPVQTLLHALEGEHFGRTEGNTEQMLLSCDLLVLDDLGTEFASPFYTSALYALINGRMLNGKPTVISTNLDVQAIYTHYGEQIASRLIGTYEPLAFVGQDIRQQKLHRQMG